MMQREASSLGTCLTLPRPAGNVNTFSLKMNIYLVIIGKVVKQSPRFSWIYREFMYSLTRFAEKENEY